MAPSPSQITLVLLFLAATPFLQANAATNPPSTVAPGPIPAPLNLTGILEKGGQFNTLLRLLKETQIGEQIESQLNNSYGGLTLFAPTDNAFKSLKPGTLNGLTAQDQTSLVLYHVLPKFYSLSMFETTSNPVRTQATGNTGVYTLNITSTSNQVNVSTGVDQTPVNNALYTTFPLAVYEVDSVLLPADLFGPKPPASAPAPLPTIKPGKKAKPAVAPTTSEESTTPSAASVKGRSLGWISVVGASGIAIGALFFL